MDTASAFVMGQATRDKELMVFDWLTAAKKIAEKKPSVASAGLDGDWEYTGGDIFENGRPVPADETYTFLASTWATPQLCMDEEYVDCFVMQSERPEWDSDTYWPAEALAALETERKEALITRKHSDVREEPVNRQQFSST